MFGHSADWKAANPNGDDITQPSQIGQSQRDSARGCARRAALGDAAHYYPQPQRGCTTVPSSAATTPLGLMKLTGLTQGSLADLATLGSVIESFQD